MGRQLNEIREEETGLKEAIGVLAHTAYTEREHAARLRSAGALLGELRQRLDGAIAFDLKRQLIEILVGHVKVDTIQSGAHKEGSVTVTYRFPMSVVTCTDMRACNSLTVQKMLTLPKYRGDLPARLTTFGDHIRNKRLNLGLTQREAAYLIGVEQCSVYNWEKRGMNPAQRVQTAIIDFLGYDPSQNGSSPPYAPVQALSILCGSSGMVPFSYGLLGPNPSLREVEDCWNGLSENRRKHYRAEPSTVLDQRTAEVPKHDGASQVVQLGNATPVSADGVPASH